MSMPQRWRYLFPLLDRPILQLVSLSSEASLHNSDVRVPVEPQRPLLSGHPMNPSCLLKHPIKKAVGGSERQRNSVSASRVHAGGQAAGWCSIPLRPCDTHTHSPPVTQEAVFHEEASLAGPKGCADLSSCHERHPSQQPTGYRLPSVRKKVLYFQQLSLTSVNRRRRGAHSSVVMHILMFRFGYGRLHCRTSPT